MKKISTPLFSFVISAALTLLSLFLFPNKKISSAEKNSGDPESPLERVQWLHSKYADPATGHLPSMGLWNAYQQLIAEGKIHGNSFTANARINPQWNLVNDFFASIAVTKITYDPHHTNVFYFCTGEGWGNLDEAVGAGVWKSIDAGNTWEQLVATNNSSFAHCQDIDVHPTTSDVYVSTLESGLMRSQDGGSTFHRVLNVQSSQNNGIADVEFTKNGGIFATSGIFQAGSIYYSDTGDSGTWVKKNDGIPSAVYRIEIATAPSNDSVAYAVTGNTTTLGIGGFYKTVDKGQTWTTLPNPGGDLNFAKMQAWYDLTMAVDPLDANIVVAGGWALWRSRDGGNTWQQLSHNNPDSAAYQYVHVDQHVTLFRNSDTIYFGNDGGVWKSNDFTADFPTIFERNYGYRVTQYYAGDIHPAAYNPIIIGGTQDNGTSMLPDWGISPFKQLFGRDGGFCAINPQQPDIMFVTSEQNGIYRLANGPDSKPDTITNPYLTNSNVLFINPIILDPNDPEMLYMASTRGLWRLKNASTAKDSAWQQASKIAGVISALAFSKSQPHLLFIGRNSGGVIYRIEGADTTNNLYTPISCDPKRQLPAGTFQSPIYCSCVYSDPKDATHVFAVYSNYGVKNIWESKNALSASAAWTCHDGDLPNLPVNWIFPHPINPEVCYIGTDLGVFYTTKLNGDSTHWFPTNNGLANVSVNMLLYRESDHTIVAVTHGRGMFIGTVNMNGPDYSITWSERGPLDVGGRTRAIMIDPNDPTGQTVWAGSVSGGLWETTNIDALYAVGVHEIAADNFQLKMFPNPVNANGATIQFSLPLNEVVSIFIYDASGKIISTICKDEKFPSGQQHMKWIPSPEISQGIYYLCLISGKKKAIQKVVYLN